MVLIRWRIPFVHKQGLNRHGRARCQFSRVHQCVHTQTIANLSQRIVQQITILSRHHVRFQVQCRSVLRNRPIQARFHLLAGVIVLAPPFRHIAARFQGNWRSLPCLIELGIGLLSHSKTIRIVVNHMAPCVGEVMPVAPAVCAPTCALLNRIRQAVFAAD